MWFAREDAPYLKYLSSLKPDWDHSGDMYMDLTQNMVRQGIDRVTAPNERVAQILDVKYDHAPGKNTIKSVKSIGGHTLHEGPTWALDREFFPSLRACDAGVHTRIVALSDDMLGSAEQVAYTDTGRGPRRDPRLWCVGRLFLAHLLGVELDLRPAEVTPFFDWNKALPSRERNEAPAFVQFYGRTAAFFGRRQLKDGHSPYFGWSLAFCP